MRKNDEKAHGAYKTKRLALEAYEALAQARAHVSEGGRPYTSPLDPPPGDPRQCHDASTRPAWAQEGG